jgi:ribosomal protein L37AE/L43A
VTANQGSVTLGRVALDAVPEIDLRMASAIDAFRRTRFVCGDLGRPGEYAFLCADHPRLGLQCFRCLMQHVERHGYDLEHTCSRCGEVVANVTAFLGVTHGVEHVRRPRGSHGVLRGDVLIASLGLCDDCLDLVGVRPTMSREDDDLELLGAVRVVDDLRPYGPTHQRLRVESIRAAAVRAHAALHEAFDGTVAMDEAVIAAVRSLSRAEQTIMRKLVEDLFTCGRCGATIARSSHIAGGVGCWVCGAPAS